LIDAYPHLIRQSRIEVLRNWQLDSRYGIVGGSPLIKIVRKAFDKDDHVIEYALSLYPPDQFHYFVILTPARTRRLSMGLRARRMASA
jgi:hypothetical protein